MGYGVMGSTAVTVPQESSRDRAFRIMNEPLPRDDFLQPIREAMREQKVKPQKGRKGKQRLKGLRP
jgi:hypothetical protein